MVVPGRIQYDCFYGHAYVYIVPTHCQRIEKSRLG